jgi:hypothetical protein
MEKLIVLTITFLIGGGLVLGSVVLKNRRYLLYLGISFLLLGISLLTPTQYRIVPMLMMLFAFVLALVTSIRSTKERFAALRHAQRNREQAFSEYLEAVAHQQPDSAAKQTSPTDNTPH